MEMKLFVIIATVILAITSYYIPAYTDSFIAILESLYSIKGISTATITSGSL